MRESFGCPSLCFPTKRPVCELCFLLFSLNNRPDNALESDNGQASRSPVGSFTGTYISSPKSSSLSEDIPESPFQMPLTDFPENSAETRFADWRTSAVPLQDQSPISVNGRQLNSLGKALNHVKALIREAEQEADTENSGQTLSPTTMVTGQLSPMQEDPSLMTCSPPTWGPAGGFHTLSSSSSHSSPHTPGSSKSSLSPGSPGFLNSPHSSSGGPTDTKEFHEFLCSSRKWLEKDFSELTLTGKWIFVNASIFLKDIESFQVCFVIPIQRSQPQTHCATYRNYPNKRRPRINGALD